MYNISYNNKSSCYVICKNKSICNSDIDDAFTILNIYFGKGNIVLFIEDIPLISDLKSIQLSNNAINYYKKGNSEYDILPSQIQKSINKINNLKLYEYVNNKKKLYIVGKILENNRNILDQNGF